MKTRTTIRSYSAIALGLMFAATTAYVMFADIKSLNDITPDHVTTAMILLGTIYAGHMIWPMAKHLRTCLHALGLILLFAVGTWYCVVSSAGRNAETDAAKASVVDQANGERERRARALVDAEKEYKDARAAEKEACKDGVGKNCRAARQTMADRETKARTAHTAFRAAPSERIANPTSKQAARVFAVFIPRSEHELESAVSLLMPFAKAMFLEIATLILLGIGLGHVTVPVAVHAVSNAVPVETVKSEPKALSFERPLTDDEVEQIRRILTGMKEKEVCNKELADKAGVTPSEMSKRWPKAVEAGIANSRRSGKHVYLSLVRPAA
jgi:DNA-binding transcriptional ArsR family regulator